MPSKRKKTKSKPAKSKQKKSKLTKSKLAKSKTATTKSASSRTKQARPHKKTAAKKQSTKKKTITAAPKQKTARRGRQLESDWRQAGAVPAAQSEDFQGLSRAEEADSESVDELVEEGNAFEAGAVEGVEEADNADEKEVHAHEVSEDDVPEEYLDKDE